MVGNIAVNSINIAEINRPQVGLKPLLGAYELSFHFSLSGAQDEREKWAVIHTARIQAKTNKSSIHDLGLAQLETPLSLKNDRPINEHFTFYLTLAASQLSKLEDMRDGHDLEFKLMIKGRGGDGQHENAVHDEWRIEMPRSKWIGLLKQAGYMDIMLLEVPMLPKGQVSDEWIDIQHDLEEAQRHFLNREYAACVSQCRKVIEEAGHQSFGEGDWYNPLLKLLGTSPRSTKKEEKSRSDMNKEERQNAIWASLLHYTHQSHHGKSRGGEKSYTRKDAQVVLTLTATFVSML